MDAPDQMIPLFQMAVTDVPRVRVPSIIIAK